MNEIESTICQCKKKEEGASMVAPLIKNNKRPSRIIGTKSNVGDLAQDGALLGIKNLKHQKLGIEKT